MGLTLAEGFESFDRQIWCHSEEMSIESESCGGDEVGTQNVPNIQDMAFPQLIASASAANRWN